MLISSDLGQTGNMVHPDGIEVAIAAMKKEGISDAEINTMLRKNPARLHCSAPWLNELVAGAVPSIEQIAAREGCSIRQVNMTISLTFLAHLVSAAIEGVCPVELASPIFAMRRSNGHGSSRCGVWLPSCIPSWHPP